MDGGLGAQATEFGGSGCAVRGRGIMGAIARYDWGGGMLLRSWACQMSQCSAVQSVSERMAWGRGVGGGPLGRPPWFAVGRCVEMVAVQSVGGSPVWSGHIHISSIHSMGD